jgi:hypothetical protein
MKPLTAPIAAVIVIIVLQGWASAQSTEVVECGVEFTGAQAESIGNPFTQGCQCHLGLIINTPCQTLRLQVDTSEHRYRHPMVNPTIKDANPEFVYRVTVRNEGTKTIRSIEWDYIFVDRETREEVGRRKFHNEQRVRSHNSKTLTEYSTSPPTKVISVKALSRPESERFIEKLVLKRVVYEDGSAGALQPQPR